MESLVFISLALTNESLDKKFCLGMAFHFRRLGLDWMQNSQPPIENQSVNNPILFVKSPIENLISNGNQQVMMSPVSDVISPRSREGTKECEGVSFAFLCAFVPSWRNHI